LAPLLIEASEPKGSVSLQVAPIPDRTCELVTGLGVLRPGLERLLEIANGFVEFVDL